ncbi:MAG: DUF4440 domain-containing protein [Candidatus Acidiferrum sp.]
MVLASRKRKFSVPPTAILLLLPVLFLFSAPISRAQSSDSNASPCSAPEYRQFDFWLGDWDAFEIGSNTKDSRIRVTRILDGCVIHEDYQSVDGHHGESFSIYDASRKVWHQSWVTSRGQLLTIEGHFKDGEMLLSGVDRTASGEERHVRGVWKPTEGGVRETAVVSTDGGKSWQPWFDLIFRPHTAEHASASLAPETDDEKAVAALDTEYQAAVKINDSATMARLLADDFILNSSSGKVFDKAALLEEARSGRYQYDHQEDTDQTVRVWGVTAVVTAKLHASGTNEGKPFDYTLWFSDTYARTPSGWRYVFGQASAPLPKTP